MLSGVSPWTESMWAGFTQIVLSLVVEAHNRMMATKKIKGDWKETRYSAILHGYLWRIRGEEDGPFWTPAREVIAEEDIEALLSGELDPDSAPRLDIVVRHSGMRQEMYFGLEAKLVGTARVRSRSAKTLAGQYVGNGMRRFVDGRYAPDAPVGAMIGYVVSGVPKKNAELIVSEIEATSFPRLQNLSPAPRPVCGAHYESVHPRVSRPTIRLHHLFLRCHVQTRPGAARAGCSPGVAR